MGRKRKKRNTKQLGRNQKREGTLGTSALKDHTYSTIFPFHHENRCIKRRISVSDDGEDTKSNNSIPTPHLPNNNGGKMTKILNMEEDKDILWHIHKCKLCPYRSKSIFVVFKHVGVHRKKSTFTCDSNTPEMYQCEPCGFETNLKVELTEHMRVFHDEKEANKEQANIMKCYRCKKCRFGTYSLLLLMKHLNNCNSMRRKPFKAVASIKTTQVISKSTDFRCSQCPFTSKRKGNLKIHTIRKHVKAEDVNWFKCGLCDYKSKVKYGLKIHMDVNHADPEDVTRFRCNQCPYETERNRNLIRHIERMHENPLGIHWFKCRHCPYKTNVEEYLRQHDVRMHDNKHWCLFACGLCPYRTNIEEYLKQHIVRMHDMNQIKCE